MELGGLLLAFGIMEKGGRSVFGKLVFIKLAMRREIVDGRE